jgi:hypothetical protein
MIHIIFIVVEFHRLDCTHLRIFYHCQNCASSISQTSWQMASYHCLKIGVFNEYSMCLTVMLQLCTKNVQCFHSLNVWWVLAAFFSLNWVYQLYSLWPRPWSSVYKSWRPFSSVCRGTVIVKIKEKNHKVTSHHFHKWRQVNSNIIMFKAIIPVQLFFVQSFKFVVILIYLILMCVFICELYPLCSAVNYLYFFVFVSSAFVLIKNKAWWRDLVHILQRAVHLPWRFDAGLRAYFPPKNHPSICGSETVLHCNNTIRFNASLYSRFVHGWAAVNRH